MQPRPCIETSSPWLPSLRVCIGSPCRVAMVFPMFCPRSRAINGPWTPRRRHPPAATATRRLHRIGQVRDSEIEFDERGLVPCVVQDWRSGEVLMLAYMDAEALERTRETNEMHFFSRSRQELWHKGATSGNTLALKAIRYDCDGDALLALVEPAGPACHTGE